MWQYARYAIPVAIFVAIGLFFYRGLALNPNDIPSPLVDKPMPTFSMPTGGRSGRDAYFRCAEGQGCTRERVGHVVRRMPPRARLSCTARAGRRSDLRPELARRTARAH